MQEAAAAAAVTASDNEIPVTTTAAAAAAAASAASAAAPRQAIPTRKVYWGSGTNRWEEIYQHIKAKRRGAEIQEAARERTPTAAVVHPHPPRYVRFMQTRERKVDALMAAREPALKPEKIVIPQSQQVRPVSKEALERFRRKWGRKGGEETVESREQEAAAREAVREPASRPEKNAVPKTKPISKEALERFRMRWSRKSGKETEGKNDAVPANEYSTSAVAKSEAEMYIEAKDDSHYDSEVQYEEPDRHSEKSAKVSNDIRMVDAEIDSSEANAEVHTTEPIEIATEAQPENQAPSTTSTSVLATLKSWVRATWTWVAQTVSQTFSS